MRRLAMVTVVAVAVGVGPGGGLAASHEDVGGTELVTKAEQEGTAVIYTANQLESEQILAREFNKRFPKVTIEVVRAPGSRLFERVRTEAAAGKLAADIVEFSEAALASKVRDIWAPSTPPSAGNYPPDSKVENFGYPKTVWGYVLAYNPAAYKGQPPASWKALTQPDLKGRIGLLPAGAGGTAWSLAMFMRRQFGLDYWRSLAQQGPRLMDSDAPLASAVISGELWVAPLKSNTTIPLQRQGAPIKTVYPREGVVLTTSLAGLTRSAPHQNAGRLYLHWVLSKEGQDVWVKESGGFSVLKGASLPEGMSPPTPSWLAPPKEYAELHDAWVAEWNNIFKYRK